MTRLSDALAVLERLEPGAALRVQANLDDFTPDAAGLMLGYAFADILVRPAIDLRTREMLTVAMLAAMGTAPGQLEFHIRAAMNTGVTRDEVVEIILQVSVYAGVPAAMNAIGVARQAFASAKGA